MSEPTYYAILEVPEGANPDEIKQAYRLLIRQVHPDSVPNASPYWRQAAEEKSKQLNEAYHVLTDPDKRASYDAQLAKHRQGVTPFASTGTTPPHSYKQPPAGTSGKQPVRRGYSWQPFIRWATQHPFRAIGLGIVFLMPVLGIFALTHNKNSISRNNGAEYEGFYSAYPCLEPRDTVSPIDGKPCRRPESATPAPEVADASPTVQPLNPPAQAARSVKTVLAKPRWFYIAPDGVHSLSGAPDDDTCTLINAKTSEGCRASLKFCPRGVWSRDCISYSKWKQKNTDPPRSEKVIPEWPSH